MTVGVLGNNSSKQTDVIMRLSLQKRWRILLIPMLGLMLTSAPVAAQGTVADLISADSPLNLLTDGGFESAMPSYWAPSGDGAEWSTEHSRTPEYSLKLSGSAEAAWTMAEAIRNWVPAHPADGEKNPEIVVGGWVYTEGVNTAPTSDAEKFQLVFEFFSDATQTENVLGEPVIIDLPQDAATTDGWVEVSSESIMSITFPEPQAAKSTRVTLRKGASATGTVYLDDIFMGTVAGAEGWVGGFFNANADVTSDFYYWWNGFDSRAAEGVIWPDDQPHFMTATMDEAYEGDYSLRIESNGLNGDETFAASERVAVDGPMLVAFRVKHEGNVAEDSIGFGTNNLGLRILGYENMVGGANGYGQVAELQLRFDGQWNGIPSDMLVPFLTHGETGKTGGADWTQYAFVWYPTAESIAMEARLSYWHGFTGVSYWDDVFIAPVGELTAATAIEGDILREGIPKTFSLIQNYPNPFNPATTIAFELKEQARVSLHVYNVMGQRVADVLDSEILSAGTQRIPFNAGDLPSGTYLYVLQVDDMTVAHKMVLLK